MITEDDVNKRALQKRRKQRIVSRAAKYHSEDSVLLILVANREIRKLMTVPTATASEQRTQLRSILLILKAAVREAHKACQAFESHDEIWRAVFDQSRPTEPKRTRRERLAALRIVQGKLS
jgi:hypothetical protein